MQVNQISDKVTHAVVGQQNSVEMGVSDSAALMHILSSALYTHPKLAAVREPICNAWDSHISAGITDKPLDIVIKPDLFSVRDYGSGIPDDKMGEIYGMYGNSTKRTDSTVTGGFGLGSKAPFAYVDNFEVISYCNGMMTVYRVSQSSMEVGGKPAINKIISLPSTETGIKVSFALKEGEHNAFFKRVQEVCILGEIKASINEQEPLEVLPLEASPTGYLINSFHGTLTEAINIRYGNVVYPVPKHDYYSAEMRSINSVMDHLWNGANIIFLAEPDSISINPSRETLILTEQTLETIKSTLSKFDTSARINAKETCRQLMAATINKVVKGLENPGDFENPVKIPANNIVGILSHSTGKIAYTVKKAVVSHTMSRYADTEEDNRPHTIFRRLEEYIRRTGGDQSFAKAIRKKYLELKRTNDYYRVKGKFTSVITRYLLGPLHKAMDQNEKMSWQRFNGVTIRSWQNSKLIRPSDIPIANLETAVSFLKPQVLIVTNKVAMHDFFHRYRHSSIPNLDNFFVYISAPTQGARDAAIKFFVEQDFTVHKSLSVIEPREVNAFVGPPKPKAPKRKGFITLASSYNSDDNNYLLTYARKNCKATDTVLDPVAWVCLNSGLHSSLRFGNFPSTLCSIIAEKWGHSIAVVTSVQADILVAKGVPSVNTYVQEYVDNTLSSAKDFPRYLAFAQYAKHDQDTLLRNLVHHKELLDKHFLRFYVSAETELLVQFFEDPTVKTPKCEEISKKVKQSSQYGKIKARIAMSKYANYFDVKALGAALKYHAPGSPALGVPYELIDKLLK